MNIMLAAVLAEGTDRHRKRRQGAPHRGSGQLPQLHGRRHHGRRHRRHQDPGRGPPARRHLLHHPRPDRGGHLYGRRGRCRRRGPASRTSFPSIWTASPPSCWRWAWRSRSGTTRFWCAATGPLTRTNVKTLPYPGFPTDMQPQIAVVLCLAEGTSVVTEGVWDNRYRYVDELRRMGAQIQVDGKVAVIEGVDQLTGAPCPGLRPAGRRGHGHRRPGRPRHHRGGLHPLY